MVAFFYYAAVARKMWFHDPVAGGERRRRSRCPPALTVAIGLTAAVVVVVGVYPQFFARVGELAFRRSTASRPASKEGDPCRRRRGSVTE